MTSFVVYRSATDIDVKKRYVLKHRERRSGMNGTCFCVMRSLRNDFEVSVKCSFRTLALKYHPLKDPTPEAAIEFSRTCEAYDVLSNRMTNFNSCFSGQALSVCAFALSLYLHVIHTDLLVL